MNVRTIGREAICDLVLETTKASRKHATLELTDGGSLWLNDSGSRNGTYMQRNDKWIRVQRVSLCIGDRIRFADAEVPLQELTAVFGRRVNIRLGAKHYYLRQGNKGNSVTTSWDQPGPALQKPKRNPLTGKIEEDRL